MLGRAKQIRDGLTIIMEHEPDADFAAQHDVLYCGSLDKIPPEAGAKLEALGWHRFESEECWGYFP